MAYTYDGVLLSKELKGNERKWNMKISDYGICATQIFNEKVEYKKSESKKKFILIKIILLFLFLIK